MDDMCAVICECSPCLVCHRVYDPQQCIGERHASQTLCMMHAVTFGTVLCNWIFFPLYIITFFGMTLAFFCQWLAWVVLPVFFLVIPFFYCYGLCTLLGRYRLVRRRRNEEES